MESNCNAWFETKRARRIWEEGDTEGQNKLFECLYDHFKTELIRRLVFRNGSIPEHVQNDMAHTAFLVAWESFCVRGQSGPDGGIMGESLLPYFCRIVKNKFIDACKKEMRNRKDHITYDVLHVVHSEEPGLIRDREDYSPRMRMAMEKIGELCRQALKWKYEDKLSHEAIALKRGIQAEASRQLLWRCRKRFIDLYNNQAS